MSIFQFNPELLERWKTYPVRISDHSPCHSCHGETVLVWYLEHGFIRRYCPACKTLELFPNKSFFNDFRLWVACPNCGKQMKERRILADKNYGFACSCESEVRLSDLLPRYEDLP